jgi:hypothetical protein
MHAAELFLVGGYRVRLQCCISGRSSVPYCRTIRWNLKLYQVKELARRTDKFQIENTEECIGMSSDRPVPPPNYGASRTGAPVLSKSLG